MTVYRYVAFDGTGKKRRGLVEGDSAEQARARLRARKLSAAKMTACGAGGGGGAQGIGWRSAVWSVRDAFRRDKSLEMALPLKELSTLLRAGVPLAQALEALAAQAEDRGVETVLRGMREAVLRGEALSAAAGVHGAYFDRVARNMMSAGEASGNLGPALARLSEQLLRRRELAGRVGSALVYPAILAAVSVSVTAFLLAYVVPRVARVYLQTGAALPAPTRLLLAFSAFLEARWLVILLGLVGAAVLVRAALKRERVARALDRAKLRLPFVGGVFRKRCVALFSGTLCGLLESGVPLVDALRVTAGTLGNRVAVSEVEAVAQEVELGGDASRAVRGKAMFPPTVAEMMAAGEESGEMVELLETLSRDYEQQVQVAAERACRMLEPLVVVMMGGVVLFIVLSVLLPIVRMGQLVKM